MGTTLLAGVNHRLARNIALDFVVMADFCLLPEVRHCLLPSRPMTGCAVTVARYREKVCVLVGEGIQHRLLLLQDSRGEPDDALSIVGEAGGDAVSAPYQFRGVSQREFRAELDEVCGRNCPESFGMGRNRHLARILNQRWGWT